MALYTLDQLRSATQDQLKTDAGLNTALSKFMRPEWMTRDAGRFNQIKNSQLGGIEKGLYQDIGKNIERYGNWNATGLDAGSQAILDKERSKAQQGIDRSWAEFTNAGIDPNSVGQLAAYAKTIGYDPISKSFTSGGQTAQQSADKVAQGTDWSRVNLAGQANTFTPVSQGTPAGQTGVDPLAVPIVSQGTTPMAQGQMGAAQSAINFRPGLNAQQQAGIQALSRKPSNQWTDTDRANWNYATNGSAMPGQGVVPTPGGSTPSPMGGTGSYTESMTGGTPTSTGEAQTGTPQSDYEKQLQALYDQIASQQAPTQEEMDAQKQIDNLMSSEAMGLNKIRDQAIPMNFLVGQSAALQRQAIAQQQPLTQRLARLQAQRAGAIDVSKTKLSAAEKIQEIQRQRQADQAASNKQSSPISIGGSLVQLNPATGKYEAVYQGASKASNLDTSVQEINGHKILINNQTGEAIKDLGAYKTTSGGSSSSSGGSTKLQSTQALGGSMQDLYDTYNGVPALKYAEMRGKAKDKLAFDLQYNWMLQDGDPGIQAAWLKPTGSGTTTTATSSAGSSAADLLNSLK